MTDYVNNPGYRMKQPRVVTVRQSPIYYKDLNANWGYDGKPLVVTESDALQQKVENVLFVLEGEEHHEPTFGSLLPYYLFEGIDDRRTIFRIEGATIGALTKFLAGEVSILHSDCIVEALPEEDAINVIVYGEDVLGNPVEWQRTLRRADFGF